MRAKSDERVRGCATKSDERARGCARKAKSESGGAREKRRASREGARKSEERVGGCARKSGAVADGVVHSEWMRRGRPKSAGVALGGGVHRPPPKAMTVWGKTLDVMRSINRALTTLGAPGRRHRLAMAALIGACLIGGLLGCPQQPPKLGRDGVLVHIASGPDSPHRALMGLKMADTMAKTRDVLVYFDVDGIELVLEGGPDVSHDGFPNAHAQLEALRAAKVKLLACPTCLAAAQKTKDDLRPGVEVATPEPFFDFSKGRILTLDY